VEEGVLHQPRPKAQELRLRQENILSSTQRKIQKQRNRSSRQASAEIRNALSGGANHLDDGQTRPKLDYY
jgi:hypothetical protein